jgi:hypothetical protein
VIYPLEALCLDSKISFEFVHIHVKVVFTVLILKESKLHNPFDPKECVITNILEVLMHLHTKYVLAKKYNGTTN